MVHMLRLGIMFLFYITFIAKGKRLKEGEVTFVRHDGYSYIALLADIVGETVTRTGCTCAIIAQEWVLTAAGCIPPNIKLKGDLYVWYKNFTMSPVQTKLMSKVQKSFVYQSYRHSAKAKSRGSLHNIGLLLVNPVRTTKHGVLSAIDYQALSGLHGTYVGGLKSSKAEAFEAYEEDYVPLEIGSGVIFRCEPTENGPKLMCVAPRCTPTKDSYAYTYNGSPLILDTKIVGIISTSHLYPIISIRFTPVSPYIDWIQNVINENDDQRKKI